MTSPGEKREIDLVYLWVNGNDPEWQEKKAAFTGERHETGKDCKARYVDNDELKHSLRSVEKYAPWVRRIFIVTDNQVPSWLNTGNPKVKIVDHREILPEESLPCFNSVVLEHRLHLIPGLSEYFLYANDDMFFNREVKPEDFFTPEGKPIIRLNRRIFRKLFLKYKEKIKGVKLDNYNLTTQRAAMLVERKTGKYIGHKPHHNIDPYRKSYNKETYDFFREEIEMTLSNHLRDDSDIQRAIYSFLPIARKKAVMKLVGSKSSFRCHIHKAHYFSDIERVKPLLFCLNDSEFASDEDRQRVKDFIEKKFPDKSQFEK